jgi:molecular chaperone GrpE
MLRRCAARLLTSSGNFAPGKVTEVANLRTWAALTIKEADKGCCQLHADAHRTHISPVLSKSKQAWFTAANKNYATAYSRDNVSEQTADPEQQAAAEAAQTSDGAKPAAEGQQGEGAAAEEAPEDHLQRQLREKEKQAADLKDQLLRTLADMENLRTRTRRDVDNAKQFAVQGFVKSLLDVADNLERAAGLEQPGNGQQASAEQATKQYRSLMEGVKLTQKILDQVFRQFGVERFSPLNEKFDPNTSSALFSLPASEGKEPGTVAVVTKTGYKLHGRIVRPAEVGVTAAAQ